jgi:hypothetical protein
MVRGINNMDIGALGSFNYGIERHFGSAYEI